MGLMARSRARLQPERSRSREPVWRRSIRASTSATGRAGRTWSAVLRPHISANYDAAKMGSSASGSSRSAIGGRAGTIPCRSPYIPETLKVTASI